MHQSVLVKSVVFFSLQQFVTFSSERMVMDANFQLGYLKWHSKMFTKIKYFLSICAIILMLVSTNHYFQFNSPYKTTFTLRNSRLITRGGLLEDPKQPKPQNALQLPWESASQEMVKGQQSIKPCKIRSHTVILEYFNIKE